MQDIVRVGLGQETQRALLRDDLQCGTVCADGVAVEIKDGYLINIEDMLEHFVFLKKAMARKDDRAQLLGSDAVPGP